MTDLESLPLLERTAKVRSMFDTESAELHALPDPKKVEEHRLKFLGRKGLITGLLEGLRDCSKEDRPVAGKSINELKKKAETIVSELQASAARYAIKLRLEEPPVDISLPVDAEATQGSLHPVTLMRLTLITEFRRLGFTIYDGPEIDFEFFNFNALNIPAHHPARDMQDTFHVENQPELVMRTHTSNIQIHSMLMERPPLRIVSLGKTYRCDSDPTHTPMFHQIEGFVVDTDINFAHLKGTLDALIKAIFGEKLKTRFRPSYFPFVEPGAEVDVECMICAGKKSGCRICKDTGWLELGGCGMIHPNVFENVEYDSEHYTGFAFGFGLDRMALLKYKLPDLRQLFEGNGRFLSQFSVTP